MRRATDTRTHILDTAQELVQTRGYNAFSYSHIAERVGIRKASIHYHFPTKSDLGRELLSRYRADARRFLGSLDLESGGPREKLERFLALERGMLIDHERLCLGCVFATDLATLPEEIREELQGFFDDGAAWISRVLNEGVRAGELRCCGDPEAEGRLFLSAVYGAMLAAKVYDDVSRFDTIVRGALTRLEAHPLK